MLHIWVIDGTTFGEIAATAPLWFVVAVFNRFLSNIRMKREECARTERVLTAIVGFKDEFGDTSLTEKIEENSPIGMALAAINRNPAERMKTGTDGLWGVVQAFASRKTPSGT